MTDFLIATDRLLIRPWRDEDRAGLQRMTGDAEMMRYVSAGRPWTADEVDEFWLRQQGHLQRLGYCVGALVRKSGNNLVGIAGMQPLGKDGDTELAWWVWKEYWRRGFATEAAQALVDYAFAKTGLQRLVAIADVPNRASIRVMQKLGMRYVGRFDAHELEARYPHVQVEKYQLLRPGPG